ncbi:MAG: tRNA (N6-isopentenyl adenosine(37)-C2)-methylthiotransferase MiaB [Deltaproteobacteria bacterium]|nr:tRNA (N6-isopentenyl adenosine(37)-C2)-methylthiotransferase MiaB [Deltaproteobacteria bacterium]
MTSILSVVQPAAPVARRYYIETWGCQMNELDTQRMAGQLMVQGLLPTRDPREADVILLNSCSIREKAENKVYSRLGEYRRFKEDREHLLIGLCGCVAQQVGERALKRVPDLDFVLGPARVGELSEVLNRRRAGERVVATGFPAERSYDFDTISRDGLFKGMVTIIEGCNKRCTFCIVPSTRGPERCRSFEDILEEVQHLLDFGFVEIELLGQTVNHWKDPHQDLDFADLLDAVARLEGLKRLRFVTSYPRDFTLAMVEQFARHENLSPYLHLPVQAGSDSLLKRMGRGYTVGEYLPLVDALRKARPGIALSTDLIVGFPGETDEEFQATLDLVEQIRYASIFAFKYSPRPGTAAPRLKNQIDDDLASERLQILFQAQKKIQLELNSELLGQEIEVLVTGDSKQPGTQMGRTPCHRIVHFDTFGEPSKLGSLQQVEITDAKPHSLLGIRRGQTSANPSLLERPSVLPVLRG